jgi:hypothetical protein
MKLKGFKGHKDLLDVIAKFDSLKIGTKHMLVEKEFLIFVERLAKEKKETDRISDTTP